MTSLISTSLSLILDSNSSYIDLNYGIHSKATLKLTNVLISWDSAADSLANGSVIFADLGELTSHTRLNGNLDDSQYLVLTNDVTKQVSNYSLDLAIGADKNVSTRIKTELRRFDGTLITNFDRVVMQFSIVFEE